MKSRKAKTKSSPKKSKKRLMSLTKLKEKMTLKRCLLWSLIIAFVFVVIGLVWSYNAATRQYHGETPVTVIIPPNSTDEAIDDSLTRHLGDYGVTVYRLWSVRGGDPLRASGIYTVNPGDKAWSIASRLIHGRSSTIKVTFNNVRLMSELADRISQSFPWRSKDFLAACDTLLPKAGFSPEQYPAAFLPDTYEFYASATPQEVVGRLLEFRNKFWNEERRDKAQKLKLTPVDVATIASIVEEESNNREEHPSIARLYINRLEKGMKLQADPTVKYALGDFGIRRLYTAQTQTESPYNTYYVKGLPPGPIRIVEASTIDDVLDAPVHDYLYMCAKQGGKGTHNFSEDYESHKANARAYQAWLDSINVK